jgi:hypothetical protein
MNNRTKAILIVTGSFVLAAVIIGLLILDEGSYNVLWEGQAEGTIGLEPGDQVEAQTFEIFLEASDKERFLDIGPHPESGWGYPDFDISVNLEGPDGTLVASVAQDYVFEAIDYDSEYETRLKFTVPEDGTYTLYVIPRSVHIDYIDLQVREKK